MKHMVSQMKVLAENPYLMLDFRVDCGDRSGLNQIKQQVHFLHRAPFDCEKNCVHFSLQRISGKNLTAAQRKILIVKTAVTLFII